MRNERLRGVFTDLGFSDVASVISSGNILFTADPEHAPFDGGALGSPERSRAEARIQTALHETLGIEGGTVLRSQAELDSLVHAAPFGDREHTKATYLLATFLKDPAGIPAGGLGEDASPAADLPTPPSSTTELLGRHGPAAAILTVTDTTAEKTPDVMVWLERAFGKEITSRTWRTVTRILAKMP